MPYSKTGLQAPFLQRALRLGRMPLLLLTLVLLLAACASLSEDQCRAGRWAGIGEADGASGHGAERIASHGEACLEYGISPVEADYLRGHARGLLRYCTATSALREGLAGHSYRGVCPPATHQAFADLHAYAYAVYRARQEIESAENEIRALERERRSDKTSPERKRDIATDLRRQDHKLYRARDAAREREIELDQAARSIRF